MALSFAAFLILLGAGTYSTFESVYAQVNVMPGSNEPANTTPSGGGYMIPGPDGNNIQVYVYTQKSGKDSTIIDRTGLKSHFVNDHIGEN